MSKPGVAFTSICQSPVIRFTLKTGSDGSLNVARASSVELEPEDAVNAGFDARMSIEEPGATESLPPLHPVRTAADATAPKRDVRAARTINRVTPSGYMMPPGPCERSRERFFRESAWERSRATHKPLRLRSELMKTRLFLLSWSIRPTFAW